MVDREVYRQERLIGWKASQALANARVIEEWHGLGGYVVEMDDFEADYAPQDFGKLRLRIVADDLPYDVSYVDTWADLRDCDREKIKQQIFRAIDSGGVWGIVGEYWSGQEWVQADSVWSFIGRNWENSGYDIDVMRAVIVQHYEHQKRAFEWLKLAL